MIVEFEQDYLQELYEKGKCRNKKYRFQPSVILKYKKCIDILIAVDTIEDLFPFRSLHYEMLSGKKKGISSIRVDYHYRLEFIVEQTDHDKTTITICSILELSNHYK